MPTIRKPILLKEVKMPKLMALAMVDGKKTPKDIAIWIIARSAYWRSEGYKRIIEEIQKIKIKEVKK